MAGMIKYLQSFRFKGMTVILGVFLAISVVLWTERSGIQYQAEIKKKAYLDRDTVVTETQAVKNIEDSGDILRLFVPEETDSFSEIWHSRSLFGNVCTDKKKHFMFFEKCLHPVQVKIIEREKPYLAVVAEGRCIKNRSFKFREIRINPGESRQDHLAETCRRFAAVPIL